MEEDDVMSDSSDSNTITSFIGAPKLSQFELFNEKQLGTLKEQQERNSVINGSDPFRHYLYLIVETKIFSLSILTVIIINTIFIGLHTSHYIVAKSEWYLLLLENIFLSVYVMELFMKMYVWRFRFFVNSWNIFDFIIVVASLIDFIVPLIVQNITANFNTQVLKVFQIFRVIKALKAFRVLRTIRFLKKLQIIVSTVLKSIPAMGSIVILISLVLYIFAIIGRGLYSEVAPERFGNLARACFTLFQLITLDDWFYMYSDIRDTYPNHQHILVYLVLFIILETFIFINLFVAVIVDNLARTQAAANLSKKHSSTNNKVSDHDSELDLTTNYKKQLLLPPSERRQRLINEFYLQTEMFSRSELDNLSRYWHLLLSLEHHINQNNIKQRTLNEVVDLIDLTKI